MKKFLAPLIHMVFLFPMTAIAMAAIEFMAQKLDVVPDYIQVFKIPYIFLIASIILISGIFIFLFANRLLHRLEKLRLPNFWDHIRQSAFFYLIAVLILINWGFMGFSGGENDVYFVSWILISIVAIGMNALFLFRIKKRSFI